MSQVHTRPVDENVENLELHKGDHFIFGIDISGSMANTDCPGNMQRIDYLKEKVKQFIHEASKYDEDGIDLISFGSNIKTYQSVKPDNADEIINNVHAIEPATNTAGLITAAYKLHKSEGHDRTVLMIATDGEPTDADAVKKAIINITNDVKTSREFCIEFLLVGVPNAALKAFLLDLDENLEPEGAKYDIVDVKNLDEVDFYSAFDGSQND